MLFTEECCNMDMYYLYKGAAMYKDKPSPQFLTNFLNYKTSIKGCSELTGLNYYTDLKLFIRFLMRKNKLVPSDMPFEEIDIENAPPEIVKNATLETISEFLSFTKDERLNQANARMRKTVSIRQFYKYLDKTYGWYIDSRSPTTYLETPKIKKTLPKHLTIEQATDLLKSASDFATWADVRDYCILVFFLNCGMRLSELVKINVNDFRTTKNGGQDGTAFLKVLGKGNKERIIYLNRACVNAYEEYMKVRPSVLGEKALFISSQSKRISNRRVEQIIEKKLESSGLDNMGFSVHKLRHTAATLMYQNGVDVRVLKEVLGHTNLDTTQIYTHVADEQMKYAMSKNPLSEESVKVKNIVERKRGKKKSD